MTSAPGGELQDCDLMISGGLVLTFDDADRIFADGAVAIDGSRIVAVGPRSEVEAHWRARRTVPARDRIVIPGLINSHNHTPLMVTRGMIEDIGFAPMYTSGVPQGHLMSADDAYAFSRLAVYDLLRSGCTTIVDNYRYPERCAQAIAELGGRGIVAGRIHDADPAALASGRYVYDRDVGRRTLDENIRLVETWNGHDGGRIRCDWQPHAPDTCSDDLLREVAQMTASHAGCIHTHLAQSRREVEVVRERSGCGPVDLLDRVGLLNHRLIAAHCIWLDDADVGRFGAAGATVAHSPIGNAKSATVAPILELAEAGARITLCTDAFSNDLFEAMRWAIAMQRVRRGRFALTPRDVLSWGTRTGADALGLDDVGALSAGLKADVVLLDATSPSLAPLIDGYGILVHGTNSGDVTDVIVDGRMVVADRRLLTASGPEIVREAQRAAERLWGEAGRRSILEV
jgi:5-methylthioadenosine/S-adenosylhomocysteine deaminase